jgi:hypothetical protein
MMINPVIDLAGGYMQSFIKGAVNGSSSSSNTSTSAAPNQHSSFAQILSSLQQLEQSNPSQYQQVTQKVAGNLQTASQLATASGNTAVASQLTRLSTDFKNASTSGQMPNVQDLAQAVGVGGGRMQHHGGASPSSSAPSGSNSSLSVLSIIDSTLSSAGIQIG